MSYTLQGTNFSRTFPAAELDTLNSKLIGSQQSYFKTDGTVVILLSEVGYLLLMQVDGARGGAPLSGRLVRRVIRTAAEGVARSASGGGGGARRDRRRSGAGAVASDDVRALMLQIARPPAAVRVECMHYW